MKKIHLAVVILFVVCFLPSCKKCSTCTHKCYACEIPGVSDVETYCRANYESQQEFMDRITEQEGMGFTCIKADQSEKICKSGLLHTMLLSEEVGSKENEGWDCDLK